MKLFFGSKFTPLLTGFCKFDITQNALLNMIEKWKHALINAIRIGTLFMDLSKALDSLSHGLLLAKLNAYNFSCNAKRFA